MRALGAPLLLVAARARRRPARWLLPALGVALAAAFVIAVAAEGEVAGDQSARAVLSGVSAVERTVRVTWRGVVTPDIAEQARGLLQGLALGRDEQTEVVLLNPVRLGGVVVRPAAIAPLDRWLRGSQASRLGPCRAESCPMLLAGGGQLPGVLQAIGVRIRIVGSSPLSSAVPLGFVPGADYGPPVVVTGDVAGLAALSGLSGVYRAHSWLALFPTARLHSWQLGAAEARLSRSQGGLVATGSQFSLSAPFNGLDAARAQAGEARRRLLLTGGGAIAALVVFIVLAGGSVRRDQLTELERLRNAGASTGQCVLFVSAESGWLCGVALSAGAGLGIAAASVLARGAGEPVGGILTHSVITPIGLLALAAAWLAASALVALSVLARSARVVDGLAFAAVCSLGVGLLVNSGGDGALAVLLAPLCCLAAGVLTYRGAAGLLRAGERLARRGPTPLYLAALSLARSPAPPSLAIAFIAVSVGLGGFALAYRATLNRGAADQAADSVPLDAVVSAGQTFVTPPELLPLGRWRVLAAGTVLPVRRTEANYGSAGGTATVPALGVPADGLTLIHGWRASDASAPLGHLARRLRPPGPVRTPGPLLPAGTRWLSLRASSPALDTSITADLRGPQGAIRQVVLGTAGARPTFLRARLPPGRWEVQAFELDEPTGLEITSGHQNGENPAAATQFEAQVTVGPLLASPDSRRWSVAASLGDWRAVGAARPVRPRTEAAATVVGFAVSGLPGIVRPAQPSDVRSVPVLADPQTAGAAGPGGRIGLTVDGLPVSARVVGVLRRFPTLAADAGGFVVADEATLAAALDAQLPGQGAADELWISANHLERLRGALASGRLRQLSASFRADLALALRTAPLARGVLGTLIAAAALSAALAVLGLLATLLGGARDERTEHDLEAQGIGARALRAEARARLTLASGLGVCIGLGLAVLLTRLAVVTVRAAGTAANPRPALVTVVPWTALAAWGIGAMASLALASQLGTRSLIGRNRARRSAPASATDGHGPPLSEGALR